MTYDPFDPSRRRPLAAQGRREAFPRVSGDPELLLEAEAARRALVAWMDAQIAAGARPKCLAYAVATLAVDLLMTTQGLETVEETLVILANTSDGGTDF